MWSSQQVWPVVWAIVATAIGLVLYKSSSALIEQRKEGRTIRLTGSVAIAVLTFFGLRWASHSFVVAVPLDQVDALKREYTDAGQEIA